MDAQLIEVLNRIAEALEAVAVGTGFIFVILTFMLFFKHSDLTTEIRHINRTLGDLVDKFKK